MKDLKFANGLLLFLRSTYSYEVNNRGSLCKEPKRACAFVVIL